MRGVSALPETAYYTPERRPRASRRPFVERIAGWSARHRKTAVFGWLLLVAAIFVSARRSARKNLPSYDAGQSGQAERILQQVAPAQYSAYAESVLIQAARPVPPSPPTRPCPGGRPGGGGAGRAAATRPASGRRSQPAAALVSKDGRSALVTFSVPGNVASVDQAATALQRAVAGVQARHPDLRIAESGDASISAGDRQLAELRQGRGDLGADHADPAAGRVRRAGRGGHPGAARADRADRRPRRAGDRQPLAAGRGSTFEVVVIIGMAVGVDYSLFYLRREREERARGRSFAEALRIAARTSGRAIVVSGLTVMTTMAGLFLVGGGPFRGMAIGTIAVVGIAVAGSLTVLPALLAWLGPRADAGRIPFLGRRRAAARPSRLWAALARRVVARPLIWGGVAAIALLALAAPALGMRLGEPAVDAPKGAAGGPHDRRHRARVPAGPRAGRGRRDRRRTSPGRRVLGRGRRAAGARRGRRRRSASRSPPPDRRRPRAGGRRAAGG